MKKILLLIFTSIFLQSCNGQKSREKAQPKVEKESHFNLNSFSLQKNSQMLEKIGLDTITAKKTESGFQFGENKDYHFTDIEKDVLYGFYNIKFIGEDNIFWSTIPLQGSEITLYLLKKDQTIRMYDIDIWNEKKGDQLIEILTKELGEPKKDISSSKKSVFLDSNGDPLPGFTEYTGMVWNKINGKTYVLVKIILNDKYLGHHLSVIDPEYKSKSGSLLKIVSMRFSITRNLIEGKDDWQEDLFK